jgi:hypothetical protein
MDSIFGTGKCQDFLHYTFVMQMSRIPNLYMSARRQDVILKIPNLEVDLGLNSRVRNRA